MRKKLFACILLLLLLTACGCGKKQAASDLRPVQTDTPGQQRTDYVNSSGTITFHPEKGYASCVRTLDEAGNHILESYLDAGGNPVRLKSGYSAIRRAYNALGQCERITYLGIDGKPVDTTSGCAVILRSYNADGRMESQLYRHASGAPAQEWTGAYGYRREYNTYGQVSAIHYLDAEGNPAPTKQGYAILRRTYRDGKTYTERYFDTAGMPTASDLGQYGVRYSYDEAGRVSEQVYLGADGKAAFLSAGYSIQRTTYNEAGEKTVSFYDAEGNPAMVQRRYHRISYEGGRERYYDTEGRALLLPDKFLHAHFGIVLCAGLGLCVAAILLPPPYRRVLLGLYLVFICYMTLMNREFGESQSRMAVFWSYRRFFESASLRKDILNNILLFVPYGALLRAIRPGRRRLLLIPLLTAAIELTQYVTGLGLCEFDDLVSNSLGGFLGYGMAALAYRFKKTD